MAEVGVENALVVCRDYLMSLGIQNTQFETVLQPDLFEEGFVQLLTDAVVINANKSPNTTAKTTHIHITGPSRHLFYTDEELRFIGGRDDEEIRVNLLNVNLSHLLFLGAERVVTPFYFDNPLYILSTHTVKKISSRGGQVQISKLKLDGTDFTNFRRGLYPNDLLIFLKYANRQDEYFVMGIPALQMQDLIQKQTHRVRELSTTRAESIGAYSINQDRDREIVSQVDLTQATEKRLDRSMRHQALLRNVANFLENAGYTLYEGMIDCLAEKDQSDVLIFEMKTLDGTATDEMNQVRDALGQLLYYDFLQSGQFEQATKIKFACFEYPISEQHQQLLLRNGCYAIWLEENNHIVGETKSINILRELHII